jgi:hypothetical protein
MLYPVYPVVPHFLFTHSRFGAQLLFTEKTFNISRIRRFGPHCCPLNRAPFGKPLEKQHYVPVRCALPKIAHYLAITERKQNYDFYTKIVCSNK